MSKQSKITAIKDAEVKQWPLADTYISEHNPRADIADGDEGIADLAKTIVASGLIQNLCGLLDDQGKVGIVAGGRRFRALQIAVLERPDLATIPVKITDDLETALSWAMLENKERVKLDKVDEIRAYGQSRENGLNVAQIAKAYCVTEAHVNKRIALSNLPAPVLDALKSGDIGYGVAKVFTRCDDEALILKVLEQAKEGWNWNEYETKNALNQDDMDADCRMMRFVGADVYAKAGGTIKTNLFDEDAAVESVDLLTRLYSEKLEDEADKFEKAEKVAWSKIEDESYIYIPDYAADQGYARLYPIAGVLTDEQQAEYDLLDEKGHWELSDDEKASLEPLQLILNGDYSIDQRALSGVIVYVDRSGDLQSHMGLVKADDIEQAVEAGFITPSQHEEIEATANDVKKPEFTAKFTGDLTAIRLAAVQTALLDKPEFVLDLLAYKLNGEYGIMATHFSNERNAPENDDEGFQLSSRLGGPLSEAEEAAQFDDDEPMRGSDWEAFEAFRKSGKKARNAIITESFARSLKTLPNDFMKMIESEVGANTRKIWTPNAANCFKRMNASQLEALFMHLLDLKPEDAHAKSFAKAKKGEKAEILHKLFNEPKEQKALNVTPEQQVRIDAWTPDFT